MEGYPKLPDNSRLERRSVSHRYVVHEAKAKIAAIVPARLVAVGSPEGAIVACDGRVVRHYGPWTWSSYKEAVEAFGRSVVATMRRRGLRMTSGQQRGYPRICSYLQTEIQTARNQKIGGAWSGDTA